MIPFSSFISEDLVDSSHELYFAFGHNTNEEHMKELDPPAKNLGEAFANGYKLVMEEYCDIRPEKGSILHGVLWSIPKDREDPINKYEQYYHKINLTVKYKGKNYKAFAYKMDSKHYDHKKPSSDYINTIRKGYKENNIPQSQLKDAVEERMNRD